MRARNAGSFRLEQEMAASATRWLHREGLSVKAEFRTRWGICDLVGFAFDTARVRNRIALGQRQPIGHELRILLLHAIPDCATGKSARPDRLLQLFSDILSVPQFEKEIAQLEKAHFVVRTRAGNLQKLNGWVPLHRRIVAIELKLCRIEDALNQARCNLAFATESYVGLPRDVADRAGNGSRRKLFDAAGVGLLSVERRNCGIIVPSKNVGGADPLLQMHCGERFWRSNVESLVRSMRRDSST